MHEDWEWMREWGGCVPSACSDVQLTEGSGLGICSRSEFHRAKEKLSKWPRSFCDDSPNLNHHLPLLKTKSKPGTLQEDEASTNWAQAALGTNHWGEQHGRWRNLS
jgi:hypothetical protein